MKKLLLAIMLLCVSCVYAADFPGNADAVLNYLYVKLGNNVAKTAISTNGIDYKMCNMQYQACKDERSILRLLTRHIAVADQLMDSKINGDGQRGLLIAYSAYKCANLNLKDKTLAAGIAIGMIQPNINLAIDDFNSENGSIYIANEVLDSAKAIDDDASIIKAFELLIILNKNFPDNLDAYRIKYAYYLYQHKYYAAALMQLDSMTEAGMIKGTIKLRNDIVGKLNKAVN